MTMTNAQYQELQDRLNADYDQALTRAHAHIANGTDYTTEEWQAEVERARIAGLPGNANWLKRTPSPLSLEQVRVNDQFRSLIRMVMSGF